MAEAKAKSPALPATAKPATSDLKRASDSNNPQMGGFARVATLLGQGSNNATLVRGGFPRVATLLGKGSNNATLKTSADSVLLTLASGWLLAAS